MARSQLPGRHCDLSEAHDPLGRSEPGNGETAPRHAHLPLARRRVGPAVGRRRGGLDDPANTALVSAASAWEVATKHRIGKLPEGAAIAMAFAQTVRELRFEALPITIEHALAAGAFDVDHRDPFDRMLAAQSAIEGAVIVTLDSAFASFGVQTLW